MKSVLLLLASSASFLAFSSKSAQKKSVSASSYQRMARHKELEQAGRTTQRIIRKKSAKQQATAACHTERLVFAAHGSLDLLVALLDAAIRAVHDQEQHQHELQQEKRRRAVDSRRGGSHVRNKWGQAASKVRLSRQPASEVSAPDSNVDRNVGESVLNVAAGRDARYLIVTTTCRRRNT